MNFSEYEAIKKVRYNGSRALRAIRGELLKKRKREREIEKEREREREIQAIWRGKQKIL